MSHKCGYCEQLFKKKSHRNDHELNKHELNGVRKCVCCEKKYRQINNFVVHFKKMHWIQCKKKNCTSKNLCGGCAKKIDSAKKCWREGKVFSISKLASKKVSELFVNLI